MIIGDNLFNIKFNCVTNGLVLYFVDIYYLSNIGFELNVKSDEIIIISFYF